MTENTPLAIHKAHELGQELENPDAEDSLEESKSWRTPGFQRMRLDWSSGDKDVLSRVKNTVDARLMREFKDAYQLMFSLYEIVRTPASDERDQWGHPIDWVRNDAGFPVEDYSKLTLREKENFLFGITTRVFTWSQLAVDAWTDAMISKAQWEERFSTGFTDPDKGTDAARTAAGRLDALDERYFAILLSSYSKKADALVRSLELLSQRLKDTLSQ